MTFSCEIIILLKTRFILETYLIQIQNFPGEIICSISISPWPLMNGSVNYTGIKFKILNIKHSNISFVPYREFSPSWRSKIITLTLFKDSWITTMGIHELSRSRRDNQTHSCKSHSLSQCHLLQWWLRCRTCTHEYSRGNTLPTKQTQCTGIWTTNEKTRCCTYASRRKVRIVAYTTSNSFGWNCESSMTSTPYMALDVGLCISGCTAAADSKTDLIICLTLRWISNHWTAISISTCIKKTNLHHR